VALCAGTTRYGHPCMNFEIEGLECCLHHMPPDLLEEAEDITGIRLCRHPSGCRFYATAGTEPPRCKCHGANTGSVLYNRAMLRLAERRYAMQYARFLATRGS
jgi:hypothetical protein